MSPLRLFLLLNITKVMPAIPRQLIPFGKTLIKGLSLAVMTNQPRNFAQFASLYFTALMEYRKVHPTLDIKDLVRDFQHQQVDAWPKSGATEEPKPKISGNIFLEKEASSHIAGNMHQDSLPGQAAATKRLPLHRIISNPNFQQPSVDRGPGPEVIGCTESEQYQQQEQRRSGVAVSLRQSDDDPYLTSTQIIHNVLPTTQPLTTKNIGEKVTVIPSTPPLMIHRMEPEMSDEQACVTTIAKQKILISKLQNTEHVDKFLPSTLQNLPEADITTEPGSAGLLSVDLKSTMFAERRRLNSKSYNVAATQTPSQCDKISRETQTHKMPSTSSGSRPKSRVTFFIPEDDEDTSAELPVSSEDPSQYDPFDVEQMPQSILGPSQPESKQQSLYMESPSIVHQQHPAFKMSKYMKHLVSYFPKRLSSPLQVTEKSIEEDSYECATPESPESTDAMQGNTLDSKMDAWPKSGAVEEPKPQISDNIFLEKEASSHIAGNMHQDSLPGQAAATKRLPLHRIISNPNVEQPSVDRGPGPEVIGCTESEQYQQQEQRRSGMAVSLRQSDDDPYLTTTQIIHHVLPTTQPLTTEYIGEKVTVIPSTPPLMIHRMEPEMSDEQACVTTIAAHETLDRGVLTDQMEGGPLQNNVSGHVDIILSSTLQYLPEADITTEPDTGEKVSVIGSTSPVMIHRKEPEMSDEQACVTATAPQEILRKGVLTDAQVEGGPLQNTVSGPVDIIVSSTLQYLPEADITTEPVSAGLLSTDLKSTMLTARQIVTSQSYNNVAATQTPPQGDRSSCETQTPTVPYTPSYNVQLEGNRQVAEMSDKTVYIPTEDASTVHIINATTSVTEPTMYIAEQTSAYCDTRPKHRVTFFIPEGDQSTSPDLPVSSQDPSQYDPSKVEQMPQTVSDPSRCVSKQQPLYKESPSTVHQQHPAFSVTEYGKHLVYHVPKRFYSPLQVTEKNIAEDSSECGTPESPEGEKKTVNVSSINELADLNQQKTSLEKHKQRTNVFIQNNEELSRSERLDRSMYSTYSPGPKQVSGEYQLYPCMEQLPPSSVQPMAITSPVYIGADEAKEAVNAFPQSLVGDDVQKAHDGKSLPGPAVSSGNNHIMPQTPATDRYTHDPLKQAPDVGTRKAPVYVSVKIRVEDLQRLLGTHSISHTGEARSALNIVEADAITTAVANSMAAQQNTIDADYDRPSEALKMDK
ncbi:uncharacterized protein LOC134928178 isoform X2 [Pseudophryne corroboree]|uniref:uncharacterized protein LOC134928178 isoform X2 n=1 Tax=Pseudophryne corroboree TaxID=495146 RepID=UPI0030819A66